MKCDGIPSGCAISGLMSEEGRRIDGSVIIRSIANMHDRSNGLGGGFAAYGIYPKRQHQYTFHMMFDNIEAKETTEEFFKDVFNVDKDKVTPNNRQCVACHRCATFCPESAITITENPLDYKYGYNWSPEIRKNILKQAESGGIILTGMGNPKPYPIYWDHMLIDACQNALTLTAM